MTAEGESWSLRAGRPEVDKVDKVLRLGQNWVKPQDKVGNSKRKGPAHQALLVPEPTAVHP